MSVPLDRYFCHFAVLVLCFEQQDAMFEESQI